ncbi:MAG TPA: PadR family transcriptional regulator, partial [Candidatus Binatia bacterium]|nr:PadR family transcriptional regulator [Candidatus Binatia bacterium]
MTKELENYIENSKAQLRKGILEFCVLLSIADAELYATDILNRLKEFDLLVVEGTLYPILSRLKEATLLS